MSKVKELIKILKNQMGHQEQLKIHIISSPKDTTGYIVISPKEFSYTPGEIITTNINEPIRVYSTECEALMNTTVNEKVIEVIIPKNTEYYMGRIIHTHYFGYLTNKVIIKNYL